MERKSQITVFVILGLVLLIMVGLALFLRNYIITPENTPIAIDKELQPLKQGIEECLYLSGKEGIIRLGMQGGYINPREYNINPNPVVPTISNSFLFDPDTSQLEDATIVPYWAYMNSDNECRSGCTFSSQRPFLYSNQGSLAIEAQLDEFIEENSKECIDEVIETFTEKNYEITGEAYSFKTTIAENDVLIELTYPLTIKSTRKTFKLSRFNTELGINFKKIYDTATRIIEVIANPTHPYLERLTIESIAPYALTIDSDLPPIAQTVETFSSRGKSMWFMPDIEEKVSELIDENIGNIQVQRTKNNVMPLVIFDDTKRNYYDNYYFSLDSVDRQYDVSNYLISFNYVPWWDSYIKVRPSSGILVKPESASSFFPLSTVFKKYIFYYDISYPVMIQIIDPNAFFGEGYTFQYGYEVNVRNTQPMAGDFTMFEVPSETVSLFCDENQRRSGNIEIVTKDKIT
ncbi:MAG: hypothetical protein ABIH52_03890, partial [Candidatus Aenigmatarchaeota archaeon]